MIHHLPLVAAGILLAILTLKQVLATTAAEPDRQVIDWVFAERNPQILEFYEGVIRRFEAENPGVSVRTRYLARMSQRLPTLVASPDKPDIIFTQGGTLLGDLYDMGAIRDLTPYLPQAYLTGFVPQAVDNFRHGNRIIGVPSYITRVDFYYNKALFRDAGIDASAIISWPDFMAAVARLKAAGITPIAAGPADPWTTGTYLGLFAMRTCGQAQFTAILAGKGKGYLEPCMIEAARRIIELARAGAFQRGFAVAKYPQAMGMFGDGKAAMVHSYSAAAYNDQAKNAADGRGLPEAQIGLLALPGDPDVADVSRDDGFGGVGGVAVMAGAPDAAIAFVRFLAAETNQRRLARLGLNIPANMAAQREVSSPLTREVADALLRSRWLQIYVENMQSPAVGQVMQNAVVDLMSDATTPEAAMRKVQQVAELD
jgi:raffinose/stachyose/melibiose transport system substrate-binding protein